MGSFKRLALRSLLPAVESRQTNASDLPLRLSPKQLPETVRQTYEHGQQLAAEKDAEGLVCVPAAAVKEGMLPEGASTGRKSGKRSGACEQCCTSACFSEWLWQ